MKYRKKIALISFALSLATLSSMLSPTCVLSQEPHFVSYIADTDIGYCIASSPDGKNVYAGGKRTIVAFRRMPNDSLQTLQVLNNHHDGVEHVEHVIDMEVSPDGRHLYAVSNINQALLIFQRDTTTGVISFAEAYHDEVFASQYGYFPAIEERFRLHISPDGKNLYWVYHDNGVLAVFSRDQQTGRPHKIQTIKNNDLVLGQFRVPTAIAISQDGRHLYGTELNGKFLTFLRTADTGEINLDHAITTSITWWPNGDIFVSPHDTLVYATGFDRDVVLEFFRHPENGRLEFSQEVARVGARAVFTAPDNQFVYALRNGGFAVLKKEPGSGRLTPIQFFRVHFTGPASVAMSPEGKHIFLTNVSRPEEMTILARDEQTGSWKVSQQFKQGNVGGTDGLFESHAVAVSPNGEHVYVTSLENSGGAGKAGLNRFARNPNDGRLTLSDFSALAKIDGIIMSPEGKHLYAVNVKDSSLYVFSVDAQTGSTELVHTLHDTLRGAISFSYWRSPGLLAFSADGAQLYVNATDRLLVYARDAHSGLLARIQKVMVQQHGLSIVQSALAVSPEGRHVYTSGIDPWSLRYYEIGIFARDSLSGSLTFARRQRFEGLLPGPVLKVAPDGRFVYSGLEANNLEQNTGEVLGVFARDAASGELTLNEVIRYPNYELCVDVEIAPNSRDVYALFHSVGIYDAMLAMLERDPISGKLTARKLFYSWTNGVYGPIAPEDFALSPEGRFIYVADVHGVATFATGRGTTAIAQQHWLSHMPYAITLEQNYPNPFSTSTTHASQGTTLIHYEIAGADESVPVELAIYNTQGQFVSTLVNEAKASGKHSSTWNGLNAQGQLAPSGVYFYRLKMGEQIVTRKMLLVQ